VARHGDLAYVLNAEDGGAVQGYLITPGQVAFSPDGRQLIVTTKANGNDIDVFAVTVGRSLSAAPTVNSEPGTVPFAITFDPAGDLVIAEPGTNSLATFALNQSGTVPLIATAATGQAATCWMTSVRGLLFADNAGSASVSKFASSPAGSLTALGSLVTTDAGRVDAAVSPSGRFLYVQTGAAGIVDEFAVSTAGALTDIGSVTVPGAVGGEGIAVGWHPSERIRAAAGYRLGRLRQPAEGAAEATERAALPGRSVTARQAATGGQSPSGRTRQL